MFKKISLSLFLIISFLFSITSVKAELVHEDTINEHGMWIPNEFVNKTKNGSTKYQQMSLIIRESDGKFLYCIEPGKSIRSGVTFKGYDGKISYFIEDEDWERIKLIAYFGYGYKDDVYDHTDIKWYVVSQFMIWQLIPNLGYDIYFTDTLNGNRITKYVDEMSEIDAMIDHYYKKPEFNTTLLKGYYNEEKNYIDANGVVNEYDIENPSGINLNVNNNTLSINYNNDIKEASIKFEKKYERFQDETLTYIYPDNQALMLPGKISNMEVNLDYKMLYGKVKLKKIDETNITYHGEAILKGAKYGLYDSSNNLIEEKETDANGNISFESRLKSGTYYLKEISPSKGYLLDTRKYSFTVDDNHLEHNITVKEKIISENFEITKLLNDDINNIIRYESGIVFKLYDKNNNLVNTYTTDDNGKFSFNLVYGDYVLKQDTVYPVYEMMKDYKISVRNNSKTNRLTFLNDLIKYKVNLNVKDKDTNKNIENIEFELYDENDNQICDLNYNCIYKTDSNGNILFPGYMNYGRYTIKLIHDDKFNYLYDDDSINFEVNEEVEYKKTDDYRLIQIYYELLQKEEIEETPKEEEEKEETKEKPKEIPKKVEPKKEVVEPPVKKETTILEPIVNEVNPVIPLSENIDDNTLTIDVPNTMKNDYTNVFIILGGVLFAIKKLLK